MSFTGNVSLSPSVCCPALPLAQTNTRLLVSQRPLTHLWPVTQTQANHPYFNTSPREGVPGRVTVKMANLIICYKRRDWKWDHTDAADRATLLAACAV